jgi:hypothetical protein
MVDDYSLSRITNIKLNSDILDKKIEKEIQFDIQKYILKIKNFKRNEIKHYCFIISNNNIISIGENDEKYHAEVNSLKKINYNKLKKYKHIDILVIRLSTDMLLTNSKPCYHCLLYMFKSNINIKNIYFSTKDGNISKIKFLDILSFNIFHISGKYYLPKNSIQINNKTIILNNAFPI